MNSMYKKLFVFCFLVCSIRANNEIETNHAIILEKYYEQYYEHYYEHYYANMGTYTCPVIKPYGYDYTTANPKTCNVILHDTTKNIVNLDEYAQPEYIIFQYAVIPPHIIEFITQIIYVAIYTIIKSILVCISLLTVVVSLGFYIR